MKKLIYISILFFGLLSFYKTYGQKADTNNYEFNCQGGQTYLTSRFDNLLVEIKDKDTLEKLKADVDSFRKACTSSIDISFSLSDKWNLICFHFSSWQHHESAGGVSINHYYVSTNIDTVFTSKQIFCEFNIGDSISLKKYPFKYFPTIYDREDELNAKWTAILPNSEYLMIRMVHSYPNGNATSWYKERIYYFKKTDK